MHRCLYIHEIVGLIASELTAGGGRATAVALACCCKIFEDPVLDALWATQDKLMPLLKTLPGDIWSSDGRNVSMVTMTLAIYLPKLLGFQSYQRLPATQEWARFRKYARNMQEVVGEHLPDNLSLQVSSILQSLAFTEPLLPNLKTLRMWEGYGYESSISLIPSFLSPKTTTIYLSVWGLGPHKAATASVITTLSTLCPNLQDIAIHHLPRDPIITTAVSELVLTTN